MVNIEGEKQNIICKTKMTGGRARHVSGSLAQGNYGRFFKLYRNAPNMGSSLIDVFIDKIRIVALQKLSVGYLATNIDTAFLTNLLAFEDV